jgi:hypothetical protein
MKAIAMISLPLMLIMLLMVNAPLAVEGGLNRTNCLQSAATACVGETETITGIVVSAGMGSGLVINTGITEEVVYGLGPQWYWTVNGVDRPDVGEIVTVRVAHVKCIDKRVILEITIGEILLELRDPLTCFPLWREAYEK